MMTHFITDVFYLGASLAGSCEENPVTGFNVNFHSTLTLLDASLLLNVNWFIMTSSVVVFSRDVSEPAVDNAVKNSETIHGQTKLACEHFLFCYVLKHGFDTQIVRLIWAFVPERTIGITALFSSLILDAIARGEPMTIPNPVERGNGLYVKYAVKVIMMLWEASIPCQRIYNVARGVNTIREVVEIALLHQPIACIGLVDGGPNTYHPVFTPCP